MWKQKTTSAEKKTFVEACCFSASQVITRMMYNPEVYNRVHNTPLLSLALRQMK
jgi:hypothetical protein